jgi:hypothetical protein
MLWAVLAGCGAMSVGWTDAVAQFSDVAVAGFVDLELGCAQAAADRQSHPALLGPDGGALIDELRSDLVSDVAVPGRVIH